MKQHPGKFKKKRVALTRNYFLWEMGIGSLAYSACSKFPSKQSSASFRKCMKLLLKN
jgi:hypothetical protein